MDLKAAVITTTTIVFVLSTMIATGLGLRVLEIVTPLRSWRLIALAFVATGQRLDPRRARASRIAPRGRGLTPAARSNGSMLSEPATADPGTRLPWEMASGASRKATNVARTAAELFLVVGQHRVEAAPGLRSDQLFAAGGASGRMR